jgi:hypothetical protein
MPKTRTFTQELDLADKQVRAKALTVWQYLRDNSIGSGCLNAELHLDAAVGVVKEGVQPVLNRVLEYKLETLELRGQIKKLKAERSSLKRKIKRLELPKRELAKVIDDKLASKGRITKKWLKSHVSVLLPERD